VSGKERVNISTNDTDGLKRLPRTCAAT